MSDRGHVVRYHYPRTTGPNDEPKNTVHGCTCRGLAKSPHEFGDSDCGYHNAAAAQPWNHSIPWNCPDYWDGCNCIENLKTRTWEQILDDHEERMNRQGAPRWKKSDV